MVNRLLRKKKPFSLSDRDLMIRTVIGEAGGESPVGRQAVAHVIRNRVNSGDFGDDISSVILAPKQFSVWNKGDKAGDYARRVSENSDLYQQTGEIVDGVMAGTLDDPTGGKVNYYNPSDASPKWGPKLAEQGSTRIGNHLFVGPGTNQSNMTIAQPIPAPQGSVNESLGNVDPVNAEAPKRRNLLGAFHENFPNGITGLRGVLSNPSWEPSGLAEMAGNLLTPDKPKLGKVLPASNAFLSQAPVTNAGAASTEVDNSIDKITVKDVPPIPSAALATPRKTPAVDEELALPEQEPVSAMPRVEEDPRPPPGPGVLGGTPGTIPDTAPDGTAYTDVEKAFLAEHPELVPVATPETPTEQAATLARAPVELTPEQSAWYSVGGNPSRGGSMNPAARAAIEAGYGPGVLVGAGIGFADEAAKQRYFEEKTGAVPNTVAVLNAASLGLASPMLGAVADPQVQENYDNKIANWDKQHAISPIVNTLAPLPALLMGTSALTGALGAGAKTLAANAPRTAPAIATITNALSTTPTAMNEASALGRFGKLAAQGGYEGAAQGAMLTPLSGGDVTDNALMGAGIGAVLNPTLGRFFGNTVGNKALDAKTTTGTKEYYQVASAVLPDDVLPRVDQLTSSPEVRQMGKNLTQEADIPQAEAFAREIGNSVGIPTGRAVTSESVEQRAVQVGTDYNNVYSRLSTLPNFNIQGPIQQSLDRTWQTIQNKVLASDRPEFERIITNIKADLASGPMNGDTLQSIISNDSELGSFMSGAKGVTKKYAGQLLDSMRKAVEQQAALANRPALSDELKALNLNYKNLMVVKDAVGNNSSGILSPRQFSAAFDSVYSDSVPMNAANKITVLRKTANYLPELTPSGSVYTHNDPIMPPFTGQAIGAMRPTGGGVSQFLGNVVPPIVHSAPGAAAAYGAGGAALGFTSLPALALGATAFAGGYAFDKLVKDAGMRELLQNPAYREAIMSGSKKAIDEFAETGMPGKLNFLRAFSKYSTAAPNAFYSQRDRRQ